MALRADPPHVVRPLVAGGLQLPVVGGALGLALAVAATRLPGGLPFEIDALDPLTFLGVPPGLAARDLSAGPPRQTGVNPVALLRSDGVRAARASRTPASGDAAWSPFRGRRRIPVLAPTARQGIPTPCPSCAFR